MTPCIATNEGCCHPNENDTMKNNPRIFTVCPDSVEITAEYVGKQLALTDFDKQAAMLAWWADAVAKYEPTDSWAMQCRYIAEELSDDECRAVSGMLSLLIEHLHAVPVERATK